MNVQQFLNNADMRVLTILNSLTLDELAIAQRLLPSVMAEKFTAEQQKLAMFQSLFLQAAPTTTIASESKTVSKKSAEEKQFQPVEKKDSWADMVDQKEREEKAETVLDSAKNFPTLAQGVATPQRRREVWRQIKEVKPEEGFEESDDKIRSFVETAKNAKDLPIPKPVEKKSTCDYADEEIRRHICGNKKCSCFFVLPRDADEDFDVKTVEKNKLFIGNVPRDVHWEDVRDALGIITGKGDCFPEKTTVPAGRLSDDSFTCIGNKGCAFMEFYSHKDATRAMKILDGLLFYGYNISANFLVRRKKVEKNENDGTHEDL